MSFPLCGMEVKITYIPAKAYNIMQRFFLFLNMNSKDRKEYRYKRRKQKRIESKIKKVQENSFQTLLNPETLIRAFKKTKLNVGWKYSVQLFESRLLVNIFELIQKLRNGESVSKGFVCFKRNERGKTRDIKSVHISERVVQRAFCDNILNPILFPSVIYDSSASQKGKGVYFARKRLVEHLRRFYVKNGNSGYVLAVDFSKYFENIDHPVLYEKLEKFFLEPEAIKCIHYFVDCFGEKSLGLGSQISQVLAVIYLCKIDHYIKEVLKIKYYGRYMDDCYIITKTKEELNFVLSKLKELCAEDKIILNSKKTRIYRTYDYFPFLKGLYKILPSGKIIRKVHKSKIKREKQKLKKLHNLRVSKKEIRKNLVSWKGGLKGFNAWHSLKGIYKYNQKLNQGAENDLSLEQKR